MRRLDLQEIHDHPRFPSFLRDLVTDAMQAIWEFGNCYGPILPRLLDSMERAGSGEVVDLCSGAGGPWPRLCREVEARGVGHIAVRLTDKYPNLAAFKKARAMSASIEFVADAVNGEEIPSGVHGFRTIFSSFHHFRPEAARGILSGAVESGQGIGVFELARRSPRTMWANCLVPVFVLLLAPAIRPFRWARLFWTYVVPVVPFVLFYDGVVSCLRAYSMEEMRELARPFQTASYSWEVGQERRGFLPVTYLIGVPRRARENTVNGKN